MLEGILDKRLEDEVGDASVEEILIDVPMDGEVAFKAHLFDFQVAAEEIDFDAEGDFGDADVVEGEAEEIGETYDHAFGAWRVGMNEFGDGVEGIEEKVRMELHAEGIELGGGEAGFELGGAETVVLIAAAEFESVVGDENYQVVESSEIDGSEDGFGKIGSVFGDELWGYERECGKIPDQLCKDGDGEGGGQMDGGVAEGAAASEGEAAAEGEDGGRDGGPDPDKSELIMSGFEPAHGLVIEHGPVVDDDYVEEAVERPEAGDDEKPVAHLGA